MRPRFDSPLRGRAPLLEGLVDQLERGPGLWTLWGPGGVGKTRLAAEALAAWGRRRPPDHVAGFCTAVAGDPDTFAGQVLAALRTPRTYRPHDPDPERLRTWLGSLDEPLLVLDEVESALEPSRELLDSLRRAAPGLRVVVTSRTPLDLEGEQLLEVPALDPDDAVQVFVDVAPGGSELEREAVAAVVARLDGLPLAIELAAARLEVLPLDQLAERLDDPFPVLRDPDAHGRNATMWRSVAASWADLPEWARAALIQLTAFDHDIPLDGAEAVIRLPGPDPDGPGALDAVQILVRRCLIGRLGGEPGEVARYRFAPFVRAFVWADPDRRDPAAVTRMERWFADLVERSIPDRRAGRTARRLDREELHLASIVARGRARRGAVEERALASCGLGLAQVTAGRRPRAWSVALIEAVLPASEAPEAHPQVHGWLLEGHASALLRAGRLDDSIAAIHRALRVAVAQDDVSQQAILWGMLGDRLYRKGLDDEGLAAFHRSLELGEACGDAVAQGNALVAISLSEDLLAEFAPARALDRLGRAADLFASVDDDVGEGMVRDRYGDVLYAEGRTEEAERAYRRALEVSSRVDRPMWIAYAQQGLGFTAIELGRTDEGRTWLAEGIRTAWSAELFDVAAHGACLLALVELEGGRGAVAAERTAEALARVEGGPPDWRTYELACRALHAAARAVEGAPLELEAARALCRDPLPEPLYAHCLDLAECIAELADLQRAIRERGVDPSEATARIGAVRARYQAIDPSYLNLLRLGRRTLAGLAQLCESAARAWVFDPNGAAFRTPDGDLHEVRSGAAARILAALVEAHGREPLSAEALIEAGWPGEVLLPKAGRNRVYVALAELRKLGLDPLDRTREGYRLDPAVPLRVEPIGSS